MEDTMPPLAAEAFEACHGAPCSSTPQHPGCQFVARPVDRFQGNRASFTRPAASLSHLPSPALRRALQSNPAGSVRQPLARGCFSDFLRGVPPDNSLNLNHLPDFVKGLTRPFRRPGPIT